MSCTEQDLLQQRSASIERSFQEIRQKASPQERQFIFENLTILKNDIQSQRSTQLKRDFDSQEDTSIESRIADENLSPAKKGSFSRNLFPDESLQLEKISRPPLFPIDMNSVTSTASSLTKDKECATVGSFRNSKQERNLRMKEKKLMGRNEKGKTGIGTKKTSSL